MLRAVSEVTRLCARGHRFLTCPRHSISPELCWAGSAREDATDRLDNATKVVHEIMAMPDNGIPEEVLEHAKCVAVVPHMVNEAKEKDKN
jgi:hypothetical protein